ncbi:uncharacterized protein UV8b_05549 [Ustilaginoidea virens]|uniref:Uncharacterized protein n=1 Tax=Ustilaginoidea virens TaxID=1159556 RepID=A0A8E5MJ05_USTVR|nr:uncharacterized protein UV8b_05549 [Ustilaginoidea virens]QUC21306.1 hypothetical protein UV8b_05549 [Ustilaginoidea virens]
MFASVVTEEARERETYRYDPSLINQVFPDADDAPVFPPRLTTDPVLSAFAELGVLRLKGSRAIISLFDRDYQYIVAEATPTTHLSPAANASQQQQSDRPGAQLLLWNRSLPRSLSICEEVLSSSKADTAFAERQSHERDAPYELPLTVFSDLANPHIAPRRPPGASWPQYGFYAGVPLRTPRGIDIGVFCLFDTKPRLEKDGSFRSMMQDLSRTIMGYLETRRFRDSQRRADRMVRGVGSFIQGISTTSGWEAAPYTKDALIWEDDTHVQAAPDKRKGIETGSGNKSHTAGHSQPASATKDNSVYVKDDPVESAKHMFSKAAKIIHKSIEADGVLFLDADISSFGGRATVGGISGNSTTAKRRLSTTTCTVYGPGDSKGGPCCKPLGFSPSSTSSNTEHADERAYSQLPEQVLREFLTRFPRGAILTLKHAHDAKPTAETLRLEELPPAKLRTSRNNLESALVNPPASAQESTSMKSDLEAFLKALLPGARNVAFFPLWDSRKRRWYAGGFAYTKRSSRLLSVEGELSYLLAFGTVIMAEVFRADAKMVERSKMDVLSSISHELRSPLHGIILGAELLHDTALDAFQGDLLHSMETCSRTLLDTVDHLLDWSGVNNFLSGAPVPQNNGDVEERGLRTEKAATIESGMMNIVTRVDVDLVVEEVVESVYAGRIFQLKTLCPGQHGNRRGMDNAQSTDSVEGIVPHKEADIATICVDIQPNASWAFYTQPGALRRIVMNLVGNSLKFTSKGFVKVSLDQPAMPEADKSECGTLVRLTVTDSGCGIGKSYLENDVFTPFTQEDELKPGMGLGLSFVERIVTALKGSISINSIVDTGTMVSVTLPLPAAVPGSATLKPSLPANDFEAERNNLRGLRVLLLGFPDTPCVDDEEGVFGTNVVERDGIANICQNWLQMQVVDPLESTCLVPDLLLCNETYLQLGRHQQTQQNAASPPAVVICSNAVSARRLAENGAYKRRPNEQLWEFSAQPVGPRKLAKVLALTFKRWTAYQATLHPIVSPVQTPEDEDGPRAGPSINDAVSVGRGDASLSATMASHASLTELTLPERIRRSTPLHAASRLPDQPCAGDCPAGQMGISFLLVDDNPINLKILTTYMKKLKLPHRTATNGQEAVDVFRQGEGAYRCVFMDISMPVMDGFEATRHIRAMETEGNLHRCTIFALTGLASAEAQQEAFTSGIDLFLTKPVKLAELSQILSARNLTN